MFIDFTQIVCPLWIVGGVQICKMSGESRRFRKCNRRGNMWLLMCLRARGTQCFLCIHGKVLKTKPYVQSYPTLINNTIGVIFVCTSCFFNNNRVLRKVYVNWANVSRYVLFCISDMCFIDIQNCFTILIKVFTFMRIV